MSKHKYSGSHTSVIEEARAVTREAEKAPEVTKIALGIIKPIRRGSGVKRLKFTEATGGWKVAVRGTGVLQEIYIYTSDKEATQATLETAFAQKNTGTKIQTKHNAKNPRAQK